MTTRLALFDLDNTLLAGDSDQAWGDFLAERGLVDGDHYRKTNNRFYEDYRTGRLDIHAYLDFALDVLTKHSGKQLAEWHRDFMREKIEPMLLPKAVQLVEKHRAAGDTLVIITATNDFVAAPIAARFNVLHLIATTAEQQDHRYTGRVVGTPCYREGKVARLQEWLARNPHSLADSIFYSDSHTDIPLLEKVDMPVAVDPNDALRTHAQQHAWPILSLR